MNIKEELCDYYRKKMRLEKTKYEIGILEGSINKIEERMKKENLESNDLIKKIIQEKKGKVLRKEIEAEELVSEIAGIDYCISELEDSEKLLLDYKFNKRYLDKDIQIEMNMSRSTIYRRITKIAEKIEEALV